MNGPGRLITSKRLGFDFWLISDPAFKPSDGLAWYYEEEIPIIGKKTDDQLRNIQEVKLVFPGAKITDARFPKAPPIPWTRKFTVKEIEDLKDWFFKKYPKEKNTYFDKPARACGPIGEVTFEDFLATWGIKFHWHSNQIGHDDLDFEIMNWKIDLKTQTSPFPYEDDFGLHIIDSQLFDKKSLINIYQWAHWNPTTLECSLMGNMTRDDFIARAVKRPAGIEVSPYFTPEVDGWEIKVSDARSEARLAWQPLGPIT